MQLPQGALFCSPENEHLNSQAIMSLDGTRIGEDGLGAGLFSLGMTDPFLIWQWVFHLFYQTSMQFMGKWNGSSSRQSYEIGILYFVISSSKPALQHNFRIQFLLFLSCGLILPKAGLVAEILASKTIIHRCICILINDSKETDLARAHHQQGSTETKGPIHTSLLTAQ